MERVLGYRYNRSQREQFLFLDYPGSRGVELFLTERSRTPLFLSLWTVSLGP
jgi:hypothetical protein